MTPPLTDQQIAERIATEIMGWELVMPRKSGVPWGEWMIDDYQGGRCVADENDAVYRDKDMHLQGRPRAWSPCTDISQAFMVVEKFFEIEGYKLTLWQEGAGRYTARFRNENRKNGWDFAMSEIGSGEGKPSAARAICLAALATLEKK